jgi:hypothetical protein
MAPKARSPRKRNIRQVYRELGLDSEALRKYLLSFREGVAESEKKRDIVFIEAGTTSESSGAFDHAGLEPDSE